MGKFYTSSAAVCPFYKYETPMAIFCEGVETGTSLKIILTQPGYKDRNCRSDWQSCPIAKMLWAIYEKSGG